MRGQERRMKRAPQDRWCWLVVVMFATAMAWFEAATVFYLRTLVDRVDPYQAEPLPIRGALGEVELVREAATLVMLLAIGMLAARTWYKRLGYAAIAFGVWDILYYVFLRTISGWPGSLYDWDVLFLLPLPWWGPVWAPVCIASLMVVWGTLATQVDDPSPASSLTWTLWGVNWAGIALALYLFMADSLRVLGQGLDATRYVLPERFNWPVFSLALVLMAAPVAHIGWRVRSWRQRVPTNRRAVPGMGDDRVPIDPMR
jgi:hypothetical protein